MTAVPAIALLLGFCVLSGVQGLQIIAGLYVATGVLLLPFTRSRDLPVPLWLIFYLIWPMYVWNRTRSQWR